MTVSDAITPETIHALLIASEAPRENGWSDARIIGYARILSLWKRNNKTPDKATTRQSAPRDDLDAVRDAIAVLRRRLPEIRELKAPLYRLFPDTDWKETFHYFSAVDEWKQRCDRLQSALFTIPAKDTPSSSLAPVGHRGSRCFWRYHEHSYGFKVRTGTEIYRSSSISGPWLQRQRADDRGSHRQR